MAAEQAESYEYATMEADREIRLFRFASFLSSDDISITMKSYPIRDVENQYLSLSYTWGDPNTTKPILCDGRRLNVTTNLWDALITLRHQQAASEEHFETLLIWADQICINQDSQGSQGEKSAQIGIMSKIYPNAKRVVCWLGREHESTPRAIRVMRDWFLAQTDENLRRHLSLSWDLTNSEDKSADQKADETALELFCSNSWFQRAWTLQEVFVDKTKSPILLCGTRSLGWDELQDAFDSLVQIVDYRRTLLYRCYVDVAYMIQIGMDRGLRASGHTDCLRLSGIVIQAGRRKAKEPKDRIFALLGIMDSEGYDYPKPDYTMTDREIFMLYTRAMIEQERCLDVLAALPSSHSHPVDYPSWALSSARLDTACPGGIFMGRSRKTRRHSATGKTRPYLLPPDASSDQVLQLYGTPIAAICRLVDLTELISALSAPSILWDQAMRFVESFSGKLGISKSYQRTGEDILAACNKTLVANEFYLGTRQPSFAYDMWTLPEQVHHRYKLVRARLQETKEEDMGATGSELTEDVLLHTLRDHFNFNRKEHRSHPSAVEIRHFTPAILSELDRHVTRDLINIINLRMVGRKLAITDNGLLAAVPNAAMEGDEVSLLMGGYLPFVLRRTTHSEEVRHELVGESYVHGLDDGETGRECEELCRRHEAGDSPLTLYNLV